MWSASVAGTSGAAGRGRRPVGVCCRSRRAAPARTRRRSSCSITYLQHDRSWTDKARAHLDLPALDLPISRTGVELYHSPRFRVVLAAGRVPRRVRSRRLRRSAARRQRRRLRARQRRVDARPAVTPAGGSSAGAIDARRAMNAQQSAARDADRSLSQRRRRPHGRRARCPST